MLDWTKREPINKDPWWEAEHSGLSLRVGVECEWFWGWSIDDGQNADLARGSMYVGTGEDTDWSTGWNYQHVERAQARCELVARALSSASLVLAECPGCGELLPESAEGLEIEDGAPLSCGCDGTWWADGDDVNPYPQHDDECRKCGEESPRTSTVSTRPALPRTPTLAEVEAGSERAAQRVASWPAWKRELGQPVPETDGTTQRIGELKQVLRDLIRASAEVRDRPINPPVSCGCGAHAGSVAWQNLKYQEDKARRMLERRNATR